MSPEDEIALQDQVHQLARLKDDQKPEAAARALQLAKDAVGILFRGGKEPDPTDGQAMLAKKAGEAMYGTGQSISIWDPDNLREAWIKADHELDPEYIAARETIQQAVDAGLESQIRNIANEMATREMDKVLTERALLQMAGADLLQTAQPKADVFKPRLDQLRESQKHAAFWIEASHRNESNVPQIQTVRGIANKA